MNLVQQLNESMVMTEGDYIIMWLHEFGRRYSYMDEAKIKELWWEFSSHDVLFGDQIGNDFEAFVDIMLAPNSIWLEIFSAARNKPIGVISFSRIILGYDAWGHFTFWSGHSRGREQLCLKVGDFLMERYNLHRLSAEIPSYQRGTIRFTERMGFKPEGVKRDGAMKDGLWVDLSLFGILRDELKESLNG